MMRLPPGEPMAMTSRPSRPSTRVGDIELRGRLSASTRLATGRPSARGAKEKSVSSLFSMKPRAMRCEPNAPSMEAVMDTALPWASTTERWEVEGGFGCRGACACWLGSPGLASPMRSEEHTSELQSLMRISYAVFCLKKKQRKKNTAQVKKKYKQG